MFRDERAELQDALTHSGVLELLNAADIIRFGSVSLSWQFNIERVLSSVNAGVNIVLMLTVDHLGVHYITTRALTLRGCFQIPSRSAPRNYRSTDAKLIAVYFDALNCDALTSSCTRMFYVSTPRLIVLAVHPVASYKSFIDGFSFTYVYIYI